MKKQNYKLGFGCFNAKCIHSLLLLFILFAFQRVSAQPLISSFTPLSGGGGTAITITGSGFNITALSNVVFLGNAPASVVSVNGAGTELIITAPNAAANYGQITVINTGTGLSAVSRQKFVYTFSNGVSPSSAMNTQFAVRNTMTGPSLSGDYNDTWSCKTSVSGDFDKDGKIDFAARNSAYAATKTLSVYQNTSTIGYPLTSSSFSLNTSVTLDNNPIHVYPFPVDMNNDGKLDIIIGTTTTNFQVLINTSTGPGNFGFTKYSFNTSGGTRETITVGDFNNDGLQDVAAITAYYANNTVNIFLNTTSGGTVSFNTTPTSITMPSKMGAIFSSDIDNDGDKDILATSEIANSPYVEKLYYIINNSSSGTLSMGTPVTLGTMSGNNYYPAGLSTGDLDDDGDEDVVVALTAYGGSDSCLWVYRNDGSLSFTKFAVSTLVGTSHNSAVNTQLRVVDINGDGKKDIIWSETGNGKYYSVMSQHAGGQLTSTSFAAYSNYNTGNFGFSMDDFNQDGKVDIVEPMYFSSTVGLISNLNTVYYSKSTGDLSLASSWNTMLNGSGTNASSLTDGTKTYILANRSSYVLSANLVINNLTMETSKLLDLGNYNLTITAPVTGASSTAYIKTSGTGLLTMNVASAGSLTFPVGNSAYNPVTITNNTGAADDFSVKVRDEVLSAGTSGSPAGGSYVQRTWDINKTNPNGGSGINFVFNWNAGEVPQPLATAALFHFSTVWQKQTGTTSSTSTSLTYTGYTGTFSPFSVAEGSFTLPVSWLSFTAARKDQTVQLQWQTATEQHTKDFVVQHSNNNNSWSNIGTVTAAGNSQNISSYNFTHIQPVEGSNYYRLVQRDADGKQSISKTVQIQFTTAVRMQVYPTPVTNGVLFVKLPAATTIRIYSSNGSLVLEQKGMAGLQQLQISQLGKGSYYLRAGIETASILVQ